MAEERKVLQIPLDDIMVENRARELYGDIDGLATSITRYGLFHPIVVTKLEDGKYKLVAGERRYRAHVRLKETTIACTLKEGLTDLEQKEIELEENVKREDFTWQELVRAKSALLDTKRALYGKRSKEGGWGLRQVAEYTGESLGTVQQDIELANAMEEHEDLAKFKNKDAAWKEWRRRKDNAAQEILAAKTKERIKNEGTSAQFTLLNGNSEEKMKDLADKTVDFILADPPYAKDLEMRSEEGPIKPYEDDEYSVMNTLSLVLAECWRVLKDDRVMMLFHDPRHFEVLKKKCVELGFMVAPAPYVWCKPSPGNTPNASFYGSSIEFVLHCQKGTRALNKPGEKNWREVARVPAGKKIHPTQKPPGILGYFIGQHSLPGELVLDPFAGSGSTLSAAVALGRRAWGCELSKDYYEKALLRLTASMATSTEKPVSSGKHPHLGLTPGTDEWTKCWAANPGDQGEMLEYIKEWKEREGMSEI